MRVLEALGLAFVFVFLPELPWARSGPVLEPHPGWIAVLVLSARYGSHGFLAGMAAAAATVGLGSAIGGAGLAGSLSHLESGPNLVALGACLAVSWVASCHTHRQAVLCKQLQVLSDRAGHAESMVQALQGVVETLRSRVDRTSASLSFLRDVASRLEGTDPVAAAEGAADLALVRSGASVVALKVGTGDSERRLVVRDAGGPDSFMPADLRSAELCVPIRAGSDRVGVIELWGLPRTTLDRATAHDLAVIASWCGPVLSHALWQQEAS
ncbi:MAG: hypothetical protein ACREAA_10155 [Candidatus Polarisedimenticolia bacterium]